MGERMSTLDKDAAKRAAAGESLGAFITFDINKLDKAQLIMLGQREALSKYLAIVNKGISNALPKANADLSRALMELGMFMKADSDAITEELGRTALRQHSATMQEIPKEPQ